MVAPRDAGLGAYLHSARNSARSSASAMMLSACRSVAKSADSGWVVIVLPLFCVVGLYVFHAT